MILDHVCAWIVIGAAAVAVSIVVGRRRHNDHTSKKNLPVIFPTYPLADLEHHQTFVDWNELQDRMAVDTRKPREVCKAKRVPGFATACWWPYCDCGE